MKLSVEYSNEPMLDIYIFETAQLIEQLEQIILANEKSNSYPTDAVNEIFRIMHTIKGSSAMMLFNNISTLAHSMEDLFYYIREQKSKEIEATLLSDIVFEGIDFIKVELLKIKNGDEVDGDASPIIEKIKEFLAFIKQSDSETALVKEETREPIEEKKQYYISAESRPKNLNQNAFKATIHFKDGCQMENIRAYTVIHNLNELTKEVYFIPEDIIENEDSVRAIREDGFKIYLKIDKSYDEMHEFLMQTIFLRSLELIQLENTEEFKQFEKPKEKTPDAVSVKIPQLGDSHSNIPKSIINVNVEKLDKMMDLMGEMVIAEAMVIQNPDLKGLKLNNFKKAARQLHKITTELQDMIMSTRMLPLSSAFQKMYRIVRDMSKKLEKEVQLVLIGEETEVDKKIIEHISDPLMHLVRNCVDHGIEPSEDRAKAGKSEIGTVSIEAKNEGGDVLIIVRDDGRGLNREMILKKAIKNGLLQKPETELSDKKIYNCIFLPGFSTKDNVSEFSGRGVGMDVVSKNIEEVGGTVSVESVEGAGTTFTIKIPLTLAIIEAMNLRVGNARYTIPINLIKESFRPKKTDIITDPDGNEMIIVRGQCYSILSLYKEYGIKTDITEFDKGILLMVEADDRAICLFADELLGQQQVVVKTLPKYITNTYKIKGLAGCTLLGDGSISLILDAAGLIN